MRQEGSLGALLPPEAAGRGARQRSTSRGRGSANHVGVVGASVGATKDAFEAMDEHGFCLLRYVHARVSVTLPGGRSLDLGQHAVLPDTGASASLMSSDLYELLRATRVASLLLAFDPCGRRCGRRTGAKFSRMESPTSKSSSRAGGVGAFHRDPSFRGGILVNCYVSEELGMVVFPAKRPGAALPLTPLYVFRFMPLRDGWTLRRSPSRRRAAARIAVRRDANRVEARPRARARSASRRRSATCIGMRGGRSPSHQHQHQDQRQNVWRRFWASG